MRDTTRDSRLLIGSGLLLAAMAVAGAGAQTAGTGTSARGTSSIAIDANTAGAACDGWGAGGAMRGGNMRGTSDRTGAAGNAQGSAGAGESRPAGDMGGLEAVQAPMSDALILARLAMGDSMEIRSAQCALSQSQNAQVRAFAQTLIDDHSADLQQGQTVAERAGIPLSGMEDSLRARMSMMRDRARAYTSNGAIGSDTATDTRNGMSGANQGAGEGSAQYASGDAAFVRRQIAMHQRMIAEMQKMRSAARDPAVREQIDRALPVMQRHLARAQELGRSLGVQDGTNGSLRGPGSR